MSDTSNHEHAVELLQQLGLKEYEAKSFVALSRRHSGTAKDISDTSAVPRTRVYDAIRALESKGLVETRHSNPQVFRAVPVEEAVETLRTEYTERADTLRETLQRLEPVDDERAEVTHEVWSLSGEQGIASRTRRLVDDAEAELVFVVGDESVLTGRLTECLTAAHERGVRLAVGTATADLHEEMQTRLPAVEVFVSGFEWLRPAASGDGTTIGRLLLTDREAVLVSSLTAAGGDSGEERAVVGRGFDNGVVAMARHLLVTGRPFDEEGSTAEF